MSRFYPTPPLTHSPEPSELGNFKPGTAGDQAPAWIYVFDIDQESDQSPNPVVLKKRIATDSDSVAHYALKVAPDAAVGADGTANLIPERIKARMSTWWPEISDLMI